MRISTLVGLAVALACCPLMLACDSSDGDGGTPAVSFDNLFPANNAIGAWAEDTASGAAGVEIAETKKDVEGLINGAADPFVALDFVAFGWEHYSDGTNGLQLQLWEMPDAATAKQVYDDLVDTASHSLHASSSWTDVASMGDAARMADTGTTYWFSARKGAYYVDVMGVQPHDDAGKAAGEAFARGVVNALP